MKRIPHFLAGLGLAFVAIERWPAVLIGMAVVWLTRLPHMPHDPYFQVIIAVALGGLLTLLLGWSAEAILILGAMALSDALAKWQGKIQSRLAKEITA